jgi:hypothetical protein
LRGAGLGRRGLRSGWVVRTVLKKERGCWLLNVSSTEEERRRCMKMTGLRERLDVMNNRK